MPQRARQMFFAGDGLTRRVDVGDILPDDDPVIAGREVLFEEVDELGHPVVAPQPAPQADSDPQPDDEVPSDDEVRERARQLGIERVGQKGRKRLEEEIAAAEAADPDSDDSESPPDPDHTEPEES